MVSFFFRYLQSKKISNDQAVTQSDPTALFTGLLATVSELVRILAGNVPDPGGSMSVEV